MADLIAGMSPDEFFRRWANASNGNGGSLSAGQSSGGGNQPTAAEIQKLASEAKKASTSFARYSASMNLTSAAQQKYRDAQTDATSTLNDLNQVLEAHRKGRIALSSEEKKELEARRKTLSSLGDGEKATQAFQNGVMAVAGMVRNIGSTMIAGQAAVASAIQGGASGFGIALAQLTANTNNQNAMTQALAGTMTSASVALMGFGLAGKLAGGAMMMYAQKVAVESDLRAQATNARNQILLSGGDALLKAYQEATRSGAVLAGGFGQMEQSLRGSRYTMEDYTAIVKQSGEQLAATGMGVGEASMMIGKVGKVLKDTRMDRQMLALGIGYQEQGMLMAQVMADMRRRDPMRELDKNEIAAKTKQYAHDLAVLTEITGKDAKARQEESRKATGQLAFQQFLAGLGKNGETVGKAMETLNPAIRQNVMDIANFGSVINKQGALMTATNPALDAMQREIYASAAAGKLTNDEALRIQGKYSKSINENMMGNRGLALAMAAPESKLAALGEKSAEVREELNKLKDVEKVIRELREAEANSAKDGKEDPQTKLMLNMVEIGQDIKKAFQDHIIDKLATMGPMLESVLRSIGKELPGVSSKGVLQAIWGQLKALAMELWKAAKEWGGVWGQAGLIAGGVVAGLVVLAGVANKIVGTYETIKALTGIFGGGKETLSSGQLPGTGGTVESRQRGGTRSPIPGSPRNGTRLPSGASIPDAGASDGLGKFGAGIKSILTGLGQGAGGLIEGILTGIANGIGAFKPPVLIGAGVLAGAIIVIGGAVAAATWMMGKALPTFAEGLTAFNTVNGDNLKQVGIGAAALGVGLAAFGAGSALASAGSIISNIGDGLIKFFGGKTTLDRFREMAELAPKLKSGAEGIVTFTKAMGELILLDIKKIDALATSLERLQKATAAPERGFFSSMGQAALGTLPDAVKKQIANGEAMNKSGTLGAGQTVYHSGKAVVWAEMLPANMTTLINGIKGTATTAPVTTVRSPGMSSSKPEERTSGGLTTASLNSLAKNDPVLFALTQLLETERSKDRAADGQTSKIDIALKLMDRIAEDMAKQTGHQAEYALWAKKNVLIKK